MNVAVLVLAGRRGIREARRLETWQRLLLHGGHTVDVVDLLVEGRGLPDVWAARTGHTVFEALRWSPRMVERRVEAADRIVCLTARTYHPAWGERTVLDYVDRLSESYADRADVLGGPWGVAFRALKGRHGRLERLGHRPATAAGRADADALGVTWLPNLCPEVPITVERREQYRDAVFVGSLSYAPNIAAIEDLERVWAEVRDRRPGATLAVCGRRPHRRVLAAATRAGFEVVADFEDPFEIWASARVAVSPMRHASGIQNKVLEAAAHGVAQVISPAAAAGVDAGFPAEVVEVSATADAVIRLLEGDDLRQSLAAAGKHHVETLYQAASWSAVLRGVLGL